MSWQTVLKGHLVDAGAAVTPAILVVRMSIPQIRLFARSPAIWPWSLARGPDTIATRQVGEHLEIKVWLPVSSFELAAAEDLYTLLQTVKEQIKTRLEGDGQLGGFCERLDTEDAKADWEQWRNTERNSARSCGPSPSRSSSG